MIRLARASQRRAAPLVPALRRDGRGLHDGVRVDFSDGFSFTVPALWLEQHCASHVNPETGQRDVAVDGVTGAKLPEDSSACAPLSASVADGGRRVAVSWESGAASSFDAAWLRAQRERPGARAGDEVRAVGAAAVADAFDGILDHLPAPEAEAPRSLGFPGKEPWDARCEAPSLPYASVLGDGGEGALRALHRHGLLFVRDTPVDKDAVAAFASAVGGAAVRAAAGSGDRHAVSHGPQRTMYGEVWGTSLAEMDASSASVADSAYSSDALPLHTDMTYGLTPPGLQVFLMKRPSDRGGESVFMDGLAVAERLRAASPRAFRLLSAVQRRFRSLDSAQGWHLEASGPVLQLAAHRRQETLLSLRHNDLDRLPLDLVPPASYVACTPVDVLGDPDAQVAAFHLEMHAAHAALDAIIADGALRHVVKLGAGDMVAVDNHRVMHARQSFRGARDVIGCYVSQEELLSRMRVLGLSV